LNKFGRTNVGGPNPKSNALADSKGQNYFYWLPKDGKVEVV